MVALILPSIYISAIVHFFKEVVAQWYAWVTGILFLGDQSLRWFLPKGKVWLDTHWPPEKRRWAEVIALIAVLLVASTAAYVKQFVARDAADHAREAAERARNAAEARVRNPNGQLPPTNVLKLPPEQIPFERGSKVVQPQAKLDPPHLVRALADLGPTPVFQTANGEVSYLGLWFQLPNEGSDTLKWRILNGEVSINGDVIQSFKSEFGILPPHLVANLDPRRAPLNISSDARQIEVKYNLEYDTVPETGVRRSDRDILIGLNWANGRKSQPLSEPQDKSRREY